MPHCELCSTAGGEVIWSDAHCRVILVGGEDAALYPGFCRVVWSTHVAEMSDLDATQSNHLMRVVLATETAVRTVVAPDKINLASLGNVVPHLHWHIIPRWRNDSRFPRPIWAAALRENPTRPQPDTVGLCAALTAALGTSTHTSN